MPTEKRTLPISWRSCPIWSVGTGYDYKTNGGQKTNGKSHKWGIFDWLSDLWQFFVSLRRHLFPRVDRERSLLSGRQVGPVAAPLPRGAAIVDHSVGQKRVLP